ncbi:MAG: hypothetical protein OXS28_17010 [Gammaproteobacteria bacterium]|nr:hypothetical protein [Gammaproteobacteria bacterium]MDE0284876.1 hypothetical protein [Gammaproteobacteria bacterium]
MKEIERHFRTSDLGVKPTYYERRICNYPSEIDLLRESLERGDLEAVMGARGLSLPRGMGGISPAPGEIGLDGPIAYGDKEVVVTQLLSEPCLEYLALFIEGMEKFPFHLEYFDGKKIYGAVAYLNENETMRTHAQQQGLFVIRATDDSISIINDEEFVPRVFPSTKPVLS